MRHFIAYHNSERMGYEDSDPTGLYTSKNTSQIGDVIWIITGSGKSPKRYSLTSWFAVSDIAPADNPRFGLTVRGTEGGALNPAAVLNDLPWFKGFFKRMAHFSLGLHEIKEPEVVQSLTLLAMSGNRPFASFAPSGTPQIRFWLQYHNYDAHGYLPGRRETKTNDISKLDTSGFEPSPITTRKAIIWDTVGDIVFMIVGYGGKPRRYVLWSWCVVGNVVERQDGLLDGFGVGHVLNPPPELAGLEFDTFRRWNANFSLGFRDISEVRYLAQIIALARERGRFELSESYAKALSAIPQEVHQVGGLSEGAIRVITVNAYERNPEARRRCLLHYGHRCLACGFDFAAVYGAAAEGIIHVHHIRSLSEIGKEYEVDPIADLRPVCPNCHAVIHSRTPAFTIEEVAGLLQRTGVLRCRTETEWADSEDGE